MYIGYNQYECTCSDGRKLFDWLVDSAYVIKNMSSVTCTTSEASAWSKLQPVVKTDFGFCTVRPQTLSIGLSSALGVMIVVIVISLLVYWKREMIQVWLFARFGFRFARNKIDDFKYDAFLSYCSDDGKYVRELVHTLEDNPPYYKLCFHHRDWLGGPSIYENILDSVTDSRRTILLLSKNFVESDWCTYEFQTAYHRVITSRTPYLIVVVIDDEVPDIQDTTLKYYVDTHTYIKWTEPWFWQKLRYSLPLKKNHRRQGCRQQDDQETLV
eukprot:GHVT01097517.1.p1 GENE.GHVT01097517.1~~GHVT01097517.1.p1  ORF type:complete len:270 (+),score=-10.58 GHVT01097517.1:882-1691(+)